MSGLQDRGHCLWNNRVAQTFQDLQIFVSALKKLFYINLSQSHAIQNIFSTIPKSKNRNSNLTFHLPKYNASLVDTVEAKSTHSWRLVSITFRIHLDFLHYRLKLITVHSALAADMYYKELLYLFHQWQQYFAFQNSSARNHLLQNGKTTVPQVQPIAPLYFCESLSTSPSFTP